MDFITFIENLGFPVAVAAASGVFIYKTQQQNREDSIRREDRMYNQLEKFGDSMDKFNETLTTIDSRLHELEDRIK